MQPMNRDFSRIGVVVLTALILIGMAAILPPASLSGNEMDRSIGASTAVAKCTRSCNADNNLNTQCVGLADGVPCYTCEHASTTVDYPDANGTTGCDSSAPGWEFPTNGSTYNCGVKKHGQCKTQKCTENLINLGTSCSDPTKAVQQTTPP